MHTPGPSAHHFIGLSISTLWGQARVLRAAELSPSARAQGASQPGWWEVVVLPTREQPDAVRRWVPEAWVWEGMLPMCEASAPHHMARERELV